MAPHALKRVQLVNKDGNVVIYQNSQRGNLSTIDSNAAGVTVKTADGTYFYPWHRVHWVEGLVRS